MDHHYQHRFPAQAVGYEQVVESADHHPVFKEHVQRADGAEYAHDEHGYRHINIVERDAQEHIPFPGAGVNAEGIAVGDIPFRHVEVFISEYAAHKCFVMSGGKRAYQHEYGKETEGIEQGAVVLPEQQGQFIHEELPEPALVVLFVQVYFLVDAGGNGVEIARYLTKAVKGFSIGEVVQGGDKTV